MVKKVIQKIKEECGKDCHGCSCGKSGASSNSVYGFGFLGALYYFLTTATSFSDGLLGIVKAILWPAFLVYQDLSLLQF